MYNIEEISGDNFKAVPTTYSVQYMYMHDGGPSNQAATLHNLIYLHILPSSPFYNATSDLSLLYGCVY